MIDNLQFTGLFFANCPVGAAPWMTAFTSAPGDAHRGEWAGWPVLKDRDIPASPTRNNYVTVSTFKRGPDGRYRRRKALFAAMHTVMIDDIGTKIQESAIALPATVRVETSTGNYQDWLRLDPPICDRELAERLVDRMVAAGLTKDGTDPGMKGVTRYGRLPVGINNKPRSTGVWLQRVVEYRPSLCYGVDEIADAYSLDLTPPKPRKITVHRPDNPDNMPVLDWLRLLGMHQERLSEGWHSIVCPWANEHTAGVVTGTAYREPAAENNFVGAFKCHHGHCERRNIGHLLRFLEAIEEQVKAQA